jgi:hypothetical protein
MPLTARAGAKPGLPRKAKSKPEQAKGEGSGSTSEKRKGNASGKASQKRPRTAKQTGGKRGAKRKSKAGSDDEDEEDVKAQEEAGNEDQLDLSLLKLLGQFTVTEKLKEANKYFCEHCGKKQDSVKRLSIRKVTRVFCFVG